MRKKRRKDRSGRNILVITCYCGHPCPAVIRVATHSEKKSIHYECPRCGASITSSAQVDLGGGKN